MLDELLEILEDTTLVVNSVIVFSSLGLVCLMIQVLLLFSVVTWPLRLVLSVLLLRVSSLTVWTERLYWVSLAALVRLKVNRLLNFHL